MMKLVDIGDLKSPSFGSIGSSPIPGTIVELRNKPHYIPLPKNFTGSMAFGIFRRGFFVTIEGNIKNTQDQWWTKIFIYK